MGFPYGFPRVFTSHRESTLGQADLKAFGALIKALSWSGEALEALRMLEVLQAVSRMPSMRSGKAIGKPWENGG